MKYSPDEYDWHHPRDVLVVHNSEFDTVAYGTPKSTPKEVTIKSPSWKPLADDLAPLPKPPHTAATGPDQVCLACEWLILRDKLKRAAQG